MIVAAIDRLGRDTIDVLETVEALKLKGVTVISMREGFDLGTPIGKCMLTMLAAVADLERSNIKARQMAGIARAKAQGRALWAEEGDRRRSRGSMATQYRGERATDCRPVRNLGGERQAGVPVP